MSNWLTSAKQLLGRAQKPEAPDFELVCLCGQAVTEPRQTLPQSILCPRCQQKHFILPVSPYPPPRPKPQRGLNAWLERPTARAGAAPPATVEEADPAQQAGEAATPQAPRPRRAGEPPRTPPARPTRGKSKTLAALTGSPSADSPRTAEPSPAIPARKVQLARARRLRPVFTPLRLVLLATIGVGLLGGWWLTRTRARARAELTLVESTRRAEELLEKGEHPAAATEYDKVLSAIALLGRDEPRALQIRQNGRETIASARLLPASLIDLLREATDSQFSSVLPWTDLFRQQYRGQWIVVDAQVLLSPRSTKGGRFQIDCDLALGTMEAHLQGDLAEFSRLPLSSDVPRRVIFAAPLLDFRPDPAAIGRWLVDLDPAAGFLWSNADRLASLGFLMDDTTQQLLREQSDLMGLSP